MSSANIVHLRSGRVSLVVDTGAAGTPVVAYWGADLGDIGDDEVAAALGATLPAPSHGAYTGDDRTGLLPERTRGLAGPQGLAGHRPDGTGWSPFLRVEGVERRADGLSQRGRDPDAALAVNTEIRLTPDGVLVAEVTVTNEGATPYHLDGVTVCLPVPQRAEEIVSLAGRWGGERHPERLPVGFGAWVREGAEGRPGHDFPLALTVATPGTGWRAGEAWAVSLAWSGSPRHVVERHPDGTVWVGAGEALLPGEVTLDPGQSYRAPRVLAAWSDRGLDGVSERWHRHMRRRPSHPKNPRPLTLNTWEAVYFDHDLPRLLALAATAAEVGVERFVLDDGWFHRRTDDTRALGDWWVDAERYPEGLHPLADRVVELGMQFGLWVEPEMVSPDSDLARSHPDWLLQVPGRLPAPWRHQQVLDLGRPEAYDLVLGRLDALAGEYPVAVFKWDHNRALNDAGGAGGAAGVRAQTLALYRMLDELRRRHPGLEIESCASGGARVDLGILERTDRVWASDSNDPVDRQDIQRWTTYVLPPELVGAHVGPAQAHTTQRVTDLGFRAVTALFGHAGIEWDILSITDEERAALAAWAATYKRLRPVLHTGTVVRADHPDTSALLHGVVAADLSSAVFAYVQMERRPAAAPAPLRFPGLDPARRYRVGIETPGGPPPSRRGWEPPWAATPLVLPGAVLERAGLAAPALDPQQAVLITLAEPG